MIIGIDFDNTIVSYSRSISVLAPEFFSDLPHSLPLTKASLKDYLLSNNRQYEWTEFQGLLYGPGMQHAVPFTNIFPILLSLKDAGFMLKIISHRTRYPYIGHQYDLHSHAFQWLNSHLKSYPGIFEEPYNSTSNSLFFCETLDSKIATISNQGCHFFIDDLLSVLCHPSFPIHCKPILFIPNSDSISFRDSKIESFNSWYRLPELISNLI